MRRRNQALLVNLGILAGLLFEYFRRAPVPIIIGTGVLLLLFANLILLRRNKQPK